MSARTWFRALTLSAVLAGVAVAGAVLLIDRARTRSAAEMAVQRLADLVDAHTRVTLRAADLQLELLARVIGDRDPTSLAGSPAILAEMLALKDRLPDAHSLWIYGPDGTVILNSFGRTDIPSAADRDFFQGALRHPGMFVGLMQRARADGSATIVFSRGIRDAAGTIRGAISTAVRAEAIDAFYKALGSVSQRALVTIVRDDGSLFFRSSPPPVDLPPRLFADLVAGLQGESGVRTGLSPVDGAERLTAYRRMAEDGLVVMVGLPLDAVDQPFRERVPLVVGLAGGAIAVLLAVAWAGGRAMRRESRAKAERDAAQAALRRTIETLEERVATEVAAREAAGAALFQAQKMQILGELTAGIAHDFNNALAVVGGNLELLDAGALDAEGRSMLATMRAGARRAAALVARLLDFSRATRLVVEPSDVGAILGGLRDMIQRSIGASIGLELELEPGLPAASTDRHQLEAAILNLVINARDAMPAGGRVTLRARSVVSPPAAPRPGPHVEVAVIDRGCGMPPDVLARALDPFFTTKPPGKGTGLGLAMVQRFATDSGGAVSLESTVGQGTTVRIFLPAAAG